MAFQTGMDMIIEGFEKAIMEMNEVGEKKTFVVDEYEGYGEYLEDYMRRFLLSRFQWTILRWASVPG